MPPLLDKYSADPEKLANLLSIPQYFDLDLYTSGRQEGSLQALLTKLKHLAQVHHEPEVLTSIAVNPFGYNFCFSGAGNLCKNIGNIMYRRSLNLY